MSLSIDHCILIQARVYIRNVIYSLQLYHISFIPGINYTSSWYAYKDTHTAEEVCSRKYRQLSVEEPVEFTVLMVPGNALSHNWTVSNLVT